MHHANLFLAAAVLLGSVTALSAEPFPASNPTEITTRDLGPSPITVPADSTPAPAAVPPSSLVAEIAAQPQEVKSGPIQRVAHAVPPRRPVAHPARRGCFCAHPSARVAKRAMPPRVAAPRAAGWLVASREPQIVVLGVGY